MSSTITKNVLMSSFGKGSRYLHAYCNETGTCSGDAVLHSLTDIAKRIILFQGYTYRLPTLLVIVEAKILYFRFWLPEENFGNIMSQISRNIPDLLPGYNNTLKILFPNFKNNILPMGYQSEFPLVKEHLENQ